MYFSLSLLSSWLEQAGGLPLSYFWSSNKRKWCQEITLQCKNSVISSKNSHVYCISGVCCLHSSLKERKYFSWLLVEIKRNFSPLRVHRVRSGESCLSSLCSAELPPCAAGGPSPNFSVSPLFSLPWALCTFSDLHVIPWPMALVTPDLSL